MSFQFDRRDFLQTSAAVGAASLFPASQLLAADTPAEPLFKISLAEWSLHNALQAGKITNLDFPRIAKEKYGIEGVEYVNQFFQDKAKDTKYLTELKGICDGLGVTSVLIMCDGEGALGDADDAKRTEAVENHYRWVEAAKFLGCHSIRVNAQSSGSYEEQQKLAADGLGRLGDFGQQHGINVIVENHGGLSSNGEWLAGVMKMVNKPNVGTLPDFGNFRLDGWGPGPGEWYDKYKGVEELMPFAKAVSAKSHVFNAEGEEAEIDYRKMMKIVLDAGYHNWVGIEWEGAEPDEYEGIRLTQKLLEKIRTEMS